MDSIEVINKKPKIFVSCRGSAEIYKPILDPEREQNLRKLWPSVDYVHCVSRDMKARMMAFGLEETKAFINYPSIDLNRFAFVKRNQNHMKSLPKSIKIVTTGRLDHQKGYVYALLAVKSLVDQGITVEYNILGEGPEYGPIKYFIVDNKLEKFVHLHGKANFDEVKAYLDSAHIFLLTSVYEGVSNAVLEAMAAGVPVITTDGGGMTEVVTSNYNGVIIPRYNPLAIFEAIKFISNNYETAVLYTMNARIIVENIFDIKSQIKIFDEKYKTALGLK
jgi:colanic acid/amylovoran biosynthesis glycosyltransferase